MSGGVPSDEIDVRIENHIAEVTLNRPQRRNALALSNWQRLVDVFRGFAGNDDVRAVILTGAGDHFCAGADISEFGAVRSTMAQTEFYDQVVDDLSDAIAQLPKPTIAAVRGFCIGGGCGIALACDFRIASPGVILAVPAARLSIVYGIRETQNLLALVGLSQAKRILFSADRLPADEAMRIGLVDRLADDPVQAARDFAGVMAMNAPLSIAGSKAILTGLALGLGNLDPAVARDAVERAVLSEDYREGQKAFLEKRPPNFRGR